jgi:hypothetical protein
MSIFDSLKGNKGRPLTAETEESIQKQKEEWERRIQGKIIRVDPRGYMFITSEHLPFKRIFGHWTSLTPDTLEFPEVKRGMKCEFLARDQGRDRNGREKGYKAIRISIIDENIDLSGLGEEDEPPTKD